MKGENEGLRVKRKGTRCSGGKQRITEKNQKVQIVLRGKIKSMREEIKNVRGESEGLLGVDNRHKKSEGGK